MIRTKTETAGSLAAPGQPPGASLAALFAGTGGRVLSMLVIFFILAGVFHLLSDGLFFTPRNLSLMLRQASIVALVAAGVSVLMIMGEIDLSIGSAVYLCSVVAATLQVELGWATVPTILATVAVGLLLGAWQGMWVVLVAVPSFVVTLAGLLAFRGIGYYATDATTIAPVSFAFGDISEAFISPSVTYVLLAAGALLALISPIRALARGGAELPQALARIVAILAGAVLLAWTFGGFRGLPAAVLWVIGVTLVLSVLMARTKFGRNAYLVGSNREAAFYSGISWGRQLFGGFMLMGAIYGLAGALLTARLGASTPSLGTYLELDAIAAAVIGGTSLRGGVGTVVGAVAGAVLLTAIDNGMSILNVSSFIQLVVKGGILLLALGLDSYIARNRRA